MYVCIFEKIIYPVYDISDHHHTTEWMLTKVSIFQIPTKHLYVRKKIIFKLHVMRNYAEMLNLLRLLMDSKKSPVFIYISMEWRYVFFNNILNSTFGLYLD